MNSISTVPERASAFAYEDLLRCARGEMFGPGNAQLPLPPMLMVDRITRIADSGGRYGRGEVLAELDIHPDLWFFGCHFAGDPVMPGCLGLDAMWQLVGFYLGWSGGLGHGRALGADAVKFSGEVKPQTRRVSYHIHIKRLIQRRMYMGIADATMYADGTSIYVAEGLRVGLFSTGVRAIEEAT